MYPNTFHGDKWRTVISNIPGISNSKNLKYFNNYIKSITLPEYSVGSYAIPQPPGFMVLNTPMGGVDLNRGLGDFTIEFVLSEDFYNYSRLWQWIYQYRSGQLSETKTSNIYKDYNMKCFTVYLLDNQRRDILEMNFHEVFCLSVSTLSLVQGSCNELTFNANFKYNEIELIPIDPMVGGDIIVPPDIDQPCGVSGTSITPSLTWEN